MRVIVMTLARFAVYLAKRQRREQEDHLTGNDSRDCHCDACGWVRGLEDDADAAFGKEWR